MLYILREETDPYFNIAAEEYVLRNFNEDVFMVWQNDPCIVIGKHQNAFAEINYQFARDKNIPVIRRITGGGTVYHDPGNLNFSFLLHGDPGKLVNYQKVTKPTLELLTDLGLKGSFDGKSNLSIDGKKFSGNSAHVFKSKVLHHGTILFNADLKNLTSSLAQGISKYSDKSVQSVPANVTNLSEYLPYNLNIGLFKSLLLAKVIKEYGVSGANPFSGAQKNDIIDMLDKKYKSWEWNFGYSPDYTFRNQIKKSGVEFKIQLSVSKGIITEARIISSASDDRLTDLENAIKHLPHLEKIIAEKLNKLNFVNILKEITVSEFISHLF